VESLHNHNNNRPISPAKLNSPDCDVNTYISMSLERTTVTEMTTISEDFRSNNSLQRKKHNNVYNNQNGSLRKGPYMSCSSEDLETETDSKDSKVFPKEHYKVSRKHNRKRNSFIEVQ